MSRDAKKDRCGWPECDAPAKSRGLCRRHYQRLFSTSDVTRAEAEMYALAAGGGRRAKAAKAAKTAKAAKPVEPAEIEPESEPEYGEDFADGEEPSVIAGQSSEADIRIAAVLEFAQALGGLEIIQRPEGHVITPDGEQGGDSLCITPDGRLRRCEYRMVLRFH